MTELKNIIATTIVITLVGCAPKEDSAPAPAPAPAPVAKVDTKGVKSVNPGAPAGTETAAAAATGAPANEALIPIEATGKEADTIAALERAIEYYTRVLQTRVPIDEAEMKTFKPVPPLKDLQQLVEHRLIRAVPAGPDGSKYVYDTTTGKVKLVK